MRYEFSNPPPQLAAFIMAKLPEVDPDATVDVVDVPTFDSFGQPDGGIARVLVIESNLITAEQVNNAVHRIAPQDAIVFAERSQARIGLAALPGWADWTAAEAETYVHDNILSGQSQAEINGWIDANVTSLATARDALKLLAESIVATRTILEAMAQAIVFIRKVLMGL